MKLFIGIVLGVAVAIAVGFGMSALFGTGILPAGVQNFLVTWQTAIAAGMGGIVTGAIVARS